MPRKLEMNEDLQAIYMEAITKSLQKNLGPDIKVAFSDDLFVCANCGHQYTGERLCPECGQ